MAKSVFRDSTLTYLPSDYQRDVVEPIITKQGQGKDRGKNISFCGSVHVEAMPDDGIAEVKWLSSLHEGGNNATTMKAVVASCDLTRSKNVVLDNLSKLKEHYPIVRGIRWILDVADAATVEFKPGTGTHVGTLRHSLKEFGTINYLQVPASEVGFACLEQFGYSFDLQCAPWQLQRAKEIMQRYPNIPVCIDHLGSLRYRKKNGSNVDDESEKKLEVWRQNMKEISQLPHVMVKISMLGNVIPEWHVNPEKREMMKDLVRLVLDWFGPSRCMTAFNWYIAPNVSDSSGEAETGPSPVEWSLYCQKV